MLVPAMSDMKKLLLLLLTTMLLHGMVRGQTDCDPLLPPTNGMVSFDNTTSGSLATYLCDEGFILLGSDETRTCYNGVWSRSEPTCNTSIFLPYGASAGDEIVPQYSYYSSAQINFTCPYFGRIEDTLHVNGIGVLSFRTPFTSYPRPFHLLYTTNMLIAPFWIHNYYSYYGRILFRLSNDEELLNSVGTSISEAFSSDFSPTLLFIATYVEIPGIFFEFNTFQVVLSTDGSQTYVMFHYQDIQQQDIEIATIGFRAEDRLQSFTLSDRHTATTALNLEGSSNVGIPGAYFYRVDQEQVILPRGYVIEDCGPLLSPLNSMVTFEGTTAGSIATYSCDDGYILVGGNGETRTCGALSGVWSNINVDLTCNASILLPYGMSAGDESLPIYFFSSYYYFYYSTSLNFTCPFFGRNEDTLYVNANGVLSFRSQFSSSNPGPFPLFNTDAVLISPFWSPSYSYSFDDENEQFLFRISDDAELLNSVGSSISEAFFSAFSPLSLFIATWVENPDQQGRFQNQSNTFQAVVSTDGRETYVMFLYHSIQWNEESATIGFNAGDGIRHFTLSDRFTSTESTLDLETSSNVGIPGAYFFRVDQEEIIVPIGSAVEGVDFIRFLDLDAQDGVESQLVMPDNNNNIIENGDYFSEPIFVNTGIPLGGQGETANQLYVLSDGAITFQRGVRLFAPQQFPLSNESNIQLVAPFLADHDPREVGNVKYKVYDMNSLGGMDTVSSFIRNSTSSDNFIGNWMLVAEWRDVPMFRGDISITNTYQALVISNGLETFTVFIYNCDLLNWIGRQGSYASIGFSVHGQTEDFPNFENSIFSQKATVKNTACRNMPFNILYSTIVYRVGVAGTVEQRARGICLERVIREQNTFDVSQQSIRFQFFLRDCPCTIFQALRDFNFNLYSESTDGLICFLGTNFQFFLPNGGKFVYKCCYLRSTGSIVSRDRDGYGSIMSLYQEPVRSINEYLSINFQRECCIDADLCDLFYEQRPPLDCSSYVPPTFSACNGDPHFLSLDGALGTFNGWGEYTLSRVGQFILQGRTTAVDPSDPTSATKFSAIAFGPPGTIVEIDLVDDSLQVLLNSVDITDTINDTNTSAVDMEPRPISFQRISENSIRTHFSAGVTITVSLSFGMLNFVGALPQTLQGIPVGLLGNFNGDPSDDLIYPNGTQIDMNSSDAQIHDFGQAWMINPEDSLFTYPDGMGPEDFSFPNHFPSFLDEVLAGASDEVMNECGSDAMCVFDATQTGNLDIGLMTKTLIETDIENRNIVANFPPNITGSTFFMVTMNQQSSFDIYVTDINLESFSIMSGDVAGGSLTRNDADDSLYTFTWTPVEIPANPIVFLATDDMNATSQYIPRIEFCQCLNNGECTLEGLLDQTANPVMLDCICDNAYEGRFCGDDVDGCRDLACFPGVECTDNPAPDEGATCGSCPEGYFQIGGKCLDYDECVGEGSGNTCEQGCVNSPGGFNCSCFDGFEAISDTQCQDFDECAGEGSGNTCEEGCVNYPGGFNCTCSDGFQVISNTQCQDIDECAGEGSGNGCEQECVNYPGGFNCSCSDGFQAISDTQCQDYDECAGEGSGNMCEQGCVNYPGGFNCTCSDGFQVISNTQCQDIDECAGEGSGNGCEQGCVNYPGGFNCSCSEGFQAISDTQCQDYDECAGEGSGNTCEQGCVNYPGGFNCTCLDGFQATSNTQCQDSDECAGEGSGNTCEQGCVNYPGGFNCTCLEGFELVNDAQCQVLPTVPVTLSPFQMDNAVVISLSSFSVEMFNADQQRLFREETASGINRYCSDNPDKCPGVRVQAQVQASDVLLTSIENNADGGIDIITYVQLLDGNLVLSLQVLLQAVELNADGYARAGFGVPSVQVLVTTDSPSLVSDAFLGIIVGAAVATILLLIIIMMVISCCYRCRQSDKKPQNSKLTDQYAYGVEENPYTTTNVLYIDEFESDNGYSNPDITNGGGEVEVYMQ